MCRIRPLECRNGSDLCTTTTTWPPTVYMGTVLSTVHIYVVVLPCVLKSASVLEANACFTARQALLTCVACLGAASHDPCSG
jgi:hypothetical protein